MFFYVKFFIFDKVREVENGYLIYDERVWIILLMEDGSY